MITNWFLGRISSTKKEKYLNKLYYWSEGLNPGNVFTLQHHVAEFGLTCQGRFSMYRFLKTCVVVS